MFLSNSLALLPSVCSIQFEWRVGSAAICTVSVAIGVFVFHNVRTPPGVDKSCVCAHTSDTQRRGLGTSTGLMYAALTNGTECIRWFIFVAISTYVEGGDALWGKATGIFAITQIATADILCSNFGEPYFCISHCKCFCGLLFGFHSSSMVPLRSFLASLTSPTPHWIFGLQILSILLVPQTKLLKILERRGQTRLQRQEALLQLFFS